MENIIKQSSEELFKELELTDEDKNKLKELYPIFKDTELNLDDFSFNIFKLSDLSHKIYFLLTDLIKVKEKLNLDTTTEENFIKYLDDIGIDKNIFSNTKNKKRSKK